MTSLRRTGQMVGLLLFLDGVIHPMFLESRLVGIMCSGDGCAQNMLDSLMDLKVLGLTMIEIQEQVTGLAFDGQCFCLDVTGHFATKVNTNKGWHMAGWDDAHKLELCLGDLRSGCKGTEMPHCGATYELVCRHGQECLEHADSR